AHLCCHRWTVSRQLCDCDRRSALRDQLPHDLLPVWRGTARRETDERVVVHERKNPRAPGYGTGYRDYGTLRSAVQRQMDGTRRLDIWGESRVVVALDNRDVAMGVPPGRPAAARHPDRIPPSICVDLECRGRR